LILVQVRFFLALCLTAYVILSHMGKKIKTPRDVNQLAAFIAELASTDSKPDLPEKPSKNPAAVELGRLGGKKGGKARAAILSAERRREIAQNAALTRWRKPTE
jgi:hypothetical protein